MEKNIQDLIDSLTLKTEKNQAIWTKTSRGNEFALDLSKGRITTDLWVDQAGEYLADFRIYNEDGVEINSVIVDVQLEPVAYRAIQKLNKAIKNKYYKIEETIESIAEEVSGEKIIGDDTKRDDKIKDDVPF